MSDEPTLFDDVDETISGHGESELKTASGLLALMQLPRIGAGRALKLAAAFGSAAEFNDSPSERRRHAAGVAVDGSIALHDVEPPPGVVVVGYFDDGYPDALRQIANPPAILWLHGHLPTRARRIAVVGTRSPTNWGITMATSIAGLSARNGISVVSGLAFGVDIAAHRAAVESGGHTTAVLGSGIDVVTPRDHLTDAQRIVETGGCLISEVPPGTLASARTLVARNRLQSGLSSATVVVQCGARSGTMRTARFAREQGRTLAVPRPPESEATVLENLGSVSLLRDGGQTVDLRTEADLSVLLAGIV